jgi:large subunit ribosomal protein L4
MKLIVRDAKGKKVGEIEAKPEVFDSKVSEAAVHQVVRAQLAAARAGTASTKTRVEVRGGGRKPWRQKGTGRARAGSIRSPIWVGGGVTFGPKPRDYSFKVPKKVKRLALRSVLTMKAKKDQILVVKDFGLKKPKTKKAVEVFKKLGILGKTTLVLENNQEVIEKSVQNIPGVKVVKVDNINVYDLLDNETLVFTPAALERVEEVLAR